MFMKLSEWGFLFDVLEYVNELYFVELRIMVIEKYL